MKYDYLTPDERLQMVRVRIQGLERDHFAAELEVETSNAEARDGRPGSGSRVSHTIRLRDEAAQSLETLRAQEAALEAEAAERRP